MNNRKIAITTIDNPFDPIDDFNNWFLFDVEKGYYTCNKLARLADAFEFDGMTQVEEDQQVEKAINRLIELDHLDIYKKVVKEDYFKGKDEALDNTNAVDAVKTDPIDVTL